MNWTISELMTPVPSVVGVATPSRRVMATALRPPLQLSHSVLEFRLPSGYFELGIESGAGRAQVNLEEVSFCLAFTMPLAVFKEPPQVLFGLLENAKINVDGYR